MPRSLHSISLYASVCDAFQSSSLMSRCRYSPQHLFNLNPRPLLSPNYDSVVCLYLFMLHPRLGQYGAVILLSGAIKSVLLYHWWWRRRAIFPCHWQTRRTAVSQVSFIRRDTIRIRKTIVLRPCDLLVVISIRTSEDHRTAVSTVATVNIQSHETSWDYSIL